MINKQRKLRVFISYSAKDKTVVRQLYQAFLKEDWIDPWLDEERILPGQQRQIEIQKALETADVAIACFSKSSLAEEGYVQSERKLIVDFARSKPDNSIFIVPVRLDDGPVPYPLNSMAAVDLYPREQREKGYQRLIDHGLRVKYDFIIGNTNASQSAHFISPTTVPASEEVKLPTFGGFDFVKIPKGKFVMGSKVSNDLAWVVDETPQRPYTIPYDYWINRFPITCEQFGEFAVSSKWLRSLSAALKKKLNYPVVKISWYDAVAYTRWLNKVFCKEIPSDLVFRLPTEAEWERASRGDCGSEWPWGNESLDELIEEELTSFEKTNDEEELVNKKKFSDFFAEAIGLNRSKINTAFGDSDVVEIKNRIEYLRCTLKLTEVGSFSPFTDSQFEVADMMGSIFEWTQSLYHPYPYDHQDGRENLETPGERVIRGCFISKNERFSVRSARRGHGSPDRKEPFLGFRIVIAPPITTNSRNSSKRKRYEPK